MILSIIIILLAGLLFGKLAGIIKLPDVCGYLIAGITIGPHVINLVSLNSINTLEPLITIALTFIAFQVGSEFKISAIKRLGSKPFIISFIVSIITMILIIIGCLVLNYSLAFSVMMGVIASSTAPAAIMTIIRNSKSKGKLTNTVLSVVAIDDIISILLFGIALSFLFPSNNSLLEPFLELFKSIIIGGFLGYIIGKITRYLKDKSEIFAIVLAFILLVVFLSDYLHLSYMLTATAMGFIFINSFRYQVTDKIIHAIDLISPLLSIMFFVLAGASLNISFIPNIWLLIVVCLILRTLGKVYGTKLATKFIDFDKTIGKYLGISLLPQTGIAVGLAVLVSPFLKEEGVILINAILATSLIFDITGSIILKKSLKKVHEVNKAN